MQSILAQLEIHDGLHTLADGVVAFIGSVVVIIAIGLLVSWLGMPFGAMFRGLRDSYRWLVRIATYVTGTRYTPVRRWIIFASWSSLCVVAVAFGPPLVIFMALLVGLIAVFGVVQHCLWDEDEQERDIVGTAKHVDVKVDLRLETVCAIALLFCLAAMGFSQLDRAYGVFAELKGSPWWLMLRPTLYVWGEVPEGVPVLDATSVYRSANFLTGASYHDPILAWATLWLRIVYEIFVVTALLQLASVAQRLAEKGDLGEIERALKFGDEKRQQRAMTKLTQLAWRRRMSAIQYLADMLRQLSFPPELRLFAAGSLFFVAKIFGGIGYLYETVNGCKQLLTEWTETENPDDWAAVQYNMGTALFHLGGLLGGAEGVEKLEAGVAALTAALKIYPRQRMPIKWAMIQHNLGSGFLALGEWLDGAKGRAMIEKAIAAFEEALEIRTESRMRADWAETMAALSAALWIQAEKLDGAESIKKLDAAAAIGEEALRVYTMREFPVEWATMQNDMGNIFASQGRRLDGEESVEKLEAAVAAHKAALKIYTDRVTPIDWAKTQSDLGIALSNLGERLGGAEGIEELEAAVAAFREALKVQTERDDPDGWVRTQHNMGEALLRLCEWLDNAKGDSYLEAAIVAYESVLKVRTEIDKPADWANTQDHLGVALWIFGDRMGGIEGIEKLDAAAAAFEDALRVHMRIDDADAAAATMENLNSVKRLLEELRDERE